MAFDQVLKEVAHFEQLQRAFDCYVPESERVYHSLLWAAINGPNLTPPIDGEGWELGTTGDPQAVATVLHDAAQRVSDAIDACTIADYRPLMKWASGYCWRVDQVDAKPAAG